MYLNAWLRFKLRNIFILITQFASKVGAYILSNVGLATGYQEGAHIWYFLAIEKCTIPV